METADFSKFGTGYCSLYSRSSLIQIFICAHTNTFSRGSSESTLDERYLLFRGSRKDTQQVQQQQRAAATAQAQQQQYNVLHMK